MRKRTRNSIALSLVSHTNVGKTTLARTLLGRDIGEVRDEPHVTEFADVHTMLESPEGDTLELWDTPGFGDSVRLLRRLRQSSNPIGWFLSQVWDRWRERPFWAGAAGAEERPRRGRRAALPGSAAETPQAAGYVKPELELLALDRQADDRPAEPARHAARRRRRRRRALAPSHRRAAPGARVLPFDAFARCWVQEIVLLEAIAQALPEERRVT